MSTLVAEDWRTLAFTAGPADRPRAERGIRAAYAAAGIEGPEHFLWVPSPAHGAIAAALLRDREEAVATLRRAGLTGFAELVETDIPADPGHSVRHAVRTLPWERVRTAAFAELGPQDWARAWTRHGRVLWEQVNGLVTRIRGGIGEMGGDEGGALLRGATLDAVLGQHDAAWLAFFDALGRSDGLPGLAEVARSAGWWWPYERIAIVSERPAELHRDEAGRLHGGDGPALSYAEGFALHAWHGMPVPVDFIAGLSGVTPERIAVQDNAELRRVMLEHYGYDRYLSETGAQPIHRDETGVLWRIDLPGDEPVVMVEVLNSTPEPDGTHRTYHLRVPPRTRTAREGVAWTFGVPETDYRPERET
jgi:hypothetical protein